MHSRRFRFTLAAVCLALLGIATRVRAAPINYGDFNGTNVQYLQVTEDSATDPTPLYGNPNLSGDSLSFNPSSFGSTASGGSSDVTDGTLATTIMTYSGSSKRIHKVNFAEAGDYTLAGGATTTANTNANVGASFFLQVV